jgi:hypothetical protein
MCRRANSSRIRDSNSDPPVVQPVDNRCIDYAIPAFLRKGMVQKRLFRQWWWWKLITVLKIFRRWTLFWVRWLTEYQIAAGPRQHGNSWFRVPQDSWPYFSLWRLWEPSDSRQPDECSPICISINSILILSFHLHFGLPSALLQTQIKSCKDPDGSVSPSNTKNRSYFPYESHMLY